MDEIIILRGTSMLDNDIHYFYHKNFSGLTPNIELGYVVKESKKEKNKIDLSIDSIKQKLHKKTIAKCQGLSSDIDNYDIYLNNKKIILQIDNIKNHIDFTNIKYPNIYLNFGNLSVQKIESITLIKYLEDFVKFYMNKKFLSNKFNYKNCLINQNEYIFSVSILLDKISKNIVTPIFDNNNTITNPDNIKKNDSMNYLIELNKIWVDNNKKTFGINWNIVQGYKNINIYSNECMLNPNKNPKKSTVVVSQPPPPPPPPPSSNNKEYPSLKIDINELQKLKEKISGCKIDG